MLQFVSTSVLNLKQTSASMSVVQHLVSLLWGISSGSSPYTRKLF